MLLNHIQIKNAKPKDKPYRMSDGDNLYLQISPKGAKSLYLSFTVNGKRDQMVLGKYPVITLAAARELKLENQRIIAEGINPKAHRKQKQIETELRHENNFEAIAREWHKQKYHTWKPKHAENIIRRLEVNLFPDLGRRPITEIKPQELLHVVRKVEERGSPTLAHRMMQSSGQIFRYAVATGRTERDVTADLRGALTPVKSKNYARLEEHQLPAFLQKLNHYDSECNGNAVTKWGFQLLILTFVRTGELRGAKWDEIDWDRKLWRIPEERMKMKEKHLVPLSEQSMALLHKIFEVTGDSYSGYLFPSYQQPRKSISENTFLRVIDLMGYKGITTSHGFRATASTILNENGYRADVIERQLAHCERNQVRAVYNHAEYLPERTEMMQWWAEYLAEKGMLIDD